MSARDNTHEGQAVDAGTLAKFPPSFCGYAEKTPRRHFWQHRDRDLRPYPNYFLGPSRHERLFSVRFDATTPPSRGRFRSNRAPHRYSFHLHDGPYAHSPIMATVSGSLWGKNPEMGLWLNLPPAGDLEGYYQDVTSLQRFTRGRSRYGYISCFPFKMNINGVSETFEWKTTRGKERRQCGGSRSYPAHALVRITNYSRDGGQIVAVVNDTREAFKITFCGMGLIGVFGKRWETMVAATGFTLWLVNSVAVDAERERARRMMLIAASTSHAACS